MNKVKEEPETAITSVKKEFQSISCRICLKQDIKTGCVLDNKIIENIKFCTGIWIRHNDKLPNHICKDCLKSLTIANQFKTTCLKAESICESLLKDTANVELSVKEGHDHKKFNIKSYVHDHSYGCQCKEEQGKIRYAVLVECENEPTVNLKEEPEAPIEDTVTTIEIETLPVQETIEASKPIKKPKKMEKKKKLHCRWCNITFKSQEEAVKHRELQHRPPYICQVCGKSFSSYTVHYLHVRTHRVPNLECDHCGYRTAIKYALSIHMRTHSVGPKRYKCDQCPGEYHTSSNLAKHRVTVHERAKRYACDVCGVMFYERCDLDEHVDSHNNVRRFKCELCGLKLTKRWSWKNHMLKKHGIALPRYKPGRKKVYQIVGDDGTPADQTSG